MQEFIARNTFHMSKNNLFSLLLSRMVLSIVLTIDCMSSYLQVSYLPYQNNVLYFQWFTVSDSQLTNLSVNRSRPRIHLPVAGGEHCPYI